MIAIPIGDIPAEERHLVPFQPPKPKRRRRRKRKKSRQLKHPQEAGPAGSASFVR